MFPAPDTPWLGDVVNGTDLPSLGLGRYGSLAALCQGRQPHCAVIPPKQEPLEPPGTVVMPAVTRAASQEIPGVVGFWGGSKGM